MTTSPRTHDETSAPRVESPLPEEATAVAPLAETRALDAALGFGNLDAQTESTRTGPASRTGVPPHAVLSRPRPVAGAAEPKASLRGQGVVAPPVLSLIHI